MKGVENAASQRQTHAARVNSVATARLSGKRVRVCTGTAVKSAMVLSVK